MELNATHSINITACIISQEGGGKWLRLNLLFSRAVEVKKVIIERNIITVAVVVAILKILSKGRGKTLIFFLFLGLKKLFVNLAFSKNREIQQTKSKTTAQQ